MLVSRLAFLPVSLSNVLTQESIVDSGDSPVPLDLYDSTSGNVKGSSLSSNALNVPSSK